MKEKELEAYRNRYRNWSTDDLIKAVTIDRGNYIDDVLPLMEDELRHRNVTLPPKDISVPLLQDINQPSARIPLLQRIARKMGLLFVLIGVAGIFSTRVGIWVSFFIVALGVFTLYGLKSHSYWIRILAVIMYSILFIFGLSEIPNPPVNGIYSLDWLLILFILFVSIVNIIALLEVFSIRRIKPAFHPPSQNSD
jgi:hypothetical protein